MSNLTLNVMDSANNYVPQPITQLPPIGDSADCYGGNTDMWSVSQATPVRDMIINGNLNFQAYCSQTGYGSAMTTAAAATSPTARSTASSTGRATSRA